MPPTPLTPPAGGAPSGHWREAAGGVYFSPPAWKGVRFAS